MLGLAGLPLGLRFRFLDPSADAPAAEVGELVVGKFDDPAALARLAVGADVVTYEFENVSVASAVALGALPPPRALELGQDRLVEKELFRRLGIATARFGSLAETGLPALVKSRRLGYDGKGQRRVTADEALGEHELAEELIPFDRELSIIAVRSGDGETRFWPLSDNVHRDGILRASRAPAPGAPQGEAEELAGRLLDELGYVGVLALELFEVEGRLLANEFAPRVHNTGHWTIDGAATSQFENHLRAILDLPLGSTEALSDTVMLNLVGGVPPIEQLLALPGAHLHLYGKEPRHGRKLGHLTLVDVAESTIAEATAAVEAAADG
jgi:5-(carboxyamino)imidazole ribonucleotide synthase